MLLSSLLLLLLGQVGSASFVHSHGTVEVAATVTSAGAVTSEAAAAAVAGEAATAAEVAATEAELTATTAAEVAATAAEVSSSYSSSSDCLLLLRGCAPHPPPNACHTTPHRVNGCYWANIILARTTSVSFVALG